MTNTKGLGLSLLWKSSNAIHNDLWEKFQLNFREKADIYNTLSVHDGETFAESIDRFRANWFVSYFERLAPN